MLKKDYEKVTAILKRLQASNSKRSRVERTISAFVGMKRPRASAPNPKPSVPPSEHSRNPSLSPSHHSPNRASPPHSQQSTNHSVPPSQHSTKLSFSQHSPNRSLPQSQHSHPPSSADSSFIPCAQVVPEFPSPSPPAQTPPQYTSPTPSPPSPTPTQVSPTQHSIITMNELVVKPSEQVHDPVFDGKCVWGCFCLSEHIAP